MLENGTGVHSWYYALQLAPNGKIYIAKETKDSLAVINHPNNHGLLANFQKNGVFLAGRLSSLGLPAFNQSLFYNPIIITGNCLFTNISFSLNNIPDLDSVKWNFGDVASGSNNFSNLFSPTHIFTAEGIYTVQAILYNKQGCSADTVYKKVYAGPFKVFLGNDTGFCQKDTLLLKTNIPNATNLWNNGSTDTILKVSTAGKYWVKVSLVGCTASDTIDIVQNPLPLFSLGNDTAICNNASISIQPKTTLNNVLYNWSTSSTQPLINVSNAGLYWLKITNNKGCSYIDSIVINSSQLPNYTLGNDTAICSKDTLNLNAFVSTATSYFWNTGATTPTIKVTNAGIYWCNVNSNGCVYRDSVTVSVNPLPAFSFGADKTYCGFSSFTLKPNLPNISEYLWQDGSTKDSLILVQSGTFWARVKNNFGCVFADTVQINLNQYPSFNLGKDTTLCEGQLLALNAFAPNATSYTWQNGSTNQQLQINNTGVYWCRVNAAGCIKTDTIAITYVNLPIVNLGIDTLLCNNDTLLLNAANIGATYLWNTGETTASIVAKQPKLYNVKVTKNNCTNTDGVLIQYSKTPVFNLGLNQSICSGDSIVLKPLVNVNDGNFLWNTASTNTSIVVKTEGSYFLKISNTCGSFTDTIVYTKGVCKFIIPNAFSPNGDQVNDVFLPLYGENVVKYRLTIFNRNGHIVFTSVDRNKAWDGTKNGTPLPVATYYWVLDYATSHNGNFNHLSGSITLLR
jgi:gliding motility-associated-like protein